MVVHMLRGWWCHLCLCLRSPHDRAGNYRVSGGGGVVPTGCYLPILWGGGGGSGGGAYAKGAVALLSVAFAISSRLGWELES